jgi:hypothetical protein
MKALGICWKISNFLFEKLNYKVKIPKIIKFKVKIKKICKENNYKGKFVSFLR